MALINEKEEEFDVVIKITTLDSYRKRPKKVPSATVASTPSTTSNKVLSINDLSILEQKIYNMVAAKHGIKAITIAEKLHKTSKEINHYLYGSLRKYVRIDEQYLWYLK